MSHLIKVYAVCKFSYFHLWCLIKELMKQKMKIHVAEFANSEDSDEVAHHEPLHLAQHCLPSSL